MQRRWKRKRNVQAEIPIDAVYVGRPTQWGNPFWVAEYGQGTAVNMFKDWFHADEQWALRQAARNELTGKDLVCWCDLDQPCHADVLLAYVNR